MHLRICKLLHATLQPTLQVITAHISTCWLSHRTSCAWATTSAHHAQAKPNCFQIQPSALPPLREALDCGWFDAIMPDIGYKSARVLAPGVWVHVAARRIRQLQNNVAGDAVLRAAASPCVDVSIFFTMSEGMDLENGLFFTKMSNWSPVALLIRYAKPCHQQLPLLLNLSSLVHCCKNTASSVYQSQQ